MPCEECKHAPGKGCCPYTNPAPICFEEDVCSFDIDGLGNKKCPEFVVTQGTYPGPDEAPIPNPTSLIRVDQGFDVSLSWEANGNAVHFVTGVWKYAVHLHRVDENAAVITNSGTVAMNTSATVFGVDETLTFAPNSVPPGVYKIYVTVQFIIDGKGWAAIAGFGKGMAISVYDPKANA